MKEGDGYCVDNLAIRLCSSLILSGELPNFYWYLIERHEALELHFYKKCKGLFYTKATPCTPCDNTERRKSLFMCTYTSHISASFSLQTCFNYHQSLSVLGRMIMRECKQISDWITHLWLSIHFSVVFSNRIKTCRGDSFSTQSDEKTYHLKLDGRYFTGVVGKQLAVLLPLPSIF